jgi:hypothetical protein
MRTDDILANAERLLDDARYLYDDGRARSAATLVVVALEQLGAFVEAFTHEKYPDVAVSLGLFGHKPNAHAKRQDALAAHVLHCGLAVAGSIACWAFAEQMEGTNLDYEQYEEWRKNRLHDFKENLDEWLVNVRDLMFTDAQRKVMNEHPYMKAANLLLGLARMNRLQQLREFGLYENVETKFSDEAVRQVLELASVVHVMLKQSRHMPMLAAPRFERAPLDAPIGIRNSG